MTERTTPEEMVATGQPIGQDEFQDGLDMQVAIDSLQAGNSNALLKYLARMEGLDPAKCSLRSSPWEAPPPEEEGGPKMYFVGRLDNIQAPGEEADSSFVQEKKEVPPLIDFERVEEPYQYQSMSNRREIRLLRLGPKNEEGIITGLELETFLLDDAPQYLCLSYVWGKAKRTLPVACNSRLMLLTANLYHALRMCLNRYSSSWLWADGICINQEDHVERAQQVMLMGEIYERAAMVLAHPGHYEYKLTKEAEEEGQNPNDLHWAGFHQVLNEAMTEHNQEAISIMSFLSRIWESSEPFSVKSDADWDQYMLPDQSTDDGLTIWAQLAAFWGQDWFCRAWVLQELVLAKKVVVLYNDAVLSLDAVMDFWEKARRHGLPRVLRIGPLADECARVVHLTPASYLKRLIRMRSGEEGDEESRGDNAQQIQEPIRLLDLLCMTRTSLATDNRDKVYALLGLAQDDVAKKVVPDYSPDNTTARLFLDVARKLVETGQSELLHHAGADTKTPGLPSWVPDWTFQSRSALNTRLYRCMGPTQPRIRLESASLVVRGVVLSKIKFAGMAWRFYSHDSEQPHFASFQKAPDLDIPPFNDEDGRNVILSMALIVAQDLGSVEKRYRQEGTDSAIARTLAVDCSWRGERIGPLQKESEFSGAFEAFRAFYNQGPESEADLVKPGTRVHQTAIFKWLLDFDKTTENDLQRRMVPYSESMQEASRGRRYAAISGMSIKKKRENKKLGKTFEDDDRGFIANVPWNAEKKDVVVMFEGFTTPFVLRESSSGNYQLIGDCYVHGAMDGELLRDVEGLELDENQVSADENGWKYCVRAPDGYAEFQEFVLV